MSVAWVMSVAVGALLAAAALFFCFSFGVIVGYAWRDRISRRRRLLAEKEQKLEELAHALRRAMSEHAVSTNPDASDGAIAEAIGVTELTVNRARKAVKARDAVEKRPRKVKLTLVLGGVPHEQERPGEASK
jgi:hypothetical protein